MTRFIRNNELRANVEKKIRANVEADVDNKYSISNKLKVIDYR